MSKKDVTKPMAKEYNPLEVEKEWYDWWVSKGFFGADNKTKKEKFVIVIPPPNVTGSLHLGHALTVSIEDALVRWNRMKGKETLWIPGVDHAGIATQTVVEKKLMREQKLTRHDLGREEFVKRVWSWKEQYGDRIYSQLRRMGISADWNRKVFTMDEKLSRAVMEAFIRMFNGGVIYRKKRLVNWDCTLRTAISDIEVEHISLTGHKKLSAPGHGDKTYDFGVLTEFAYQVEGSSEEIVVATTRPETMLGDTAIAVHPDDPRYKHLIGKFAIHPFVKRRLPIIGDPILVNMEFGTGAVKVTPAHDPNDYECGLRNKLDMVIILNDDGTLNENAGPFKGLKRFDGRDAVVQGLKEKGLYKGMKNNPMSIGICSRSKDIIEPIPKPQWWVSCKEMGAKAVEAVKSGELEIIPDFHRETWYRWLENIHDWCISRQLWWGHRVPAYLVCFGGVEDWDSEVNWVVGRNEQEAIQAAYSKFPNVPKEKITLKQDPDVLDTWFSSGLFPFSVFGWPEETEDFKCFYPTSLLETGHDILFFWVARMVILGQYLTGKLPFKRVYLHPMVRDAHGRKMSKSLGNVIDPLDMITGITLEQLHKQLESGNLDPKEVTKARAGQKADFPKGISECGTDATRFALCAYTSGGRDINLDVNRVASYRHFCNKLWNATKFALMNLGENFKPAPSEPITGLNVMEKWILSRLNHAITTCETGWASFDFTGVTTAIFNFWLYELCDVFLEAVKPILREASDRDSAAKHQSIRETLYTCFDVGFRLLHPFMPFITEELWQRLPRRESAKYESLVIAPYPTPASGRANEQIEKEVTEVLDILKAIRSQRNSFNLTTQRPKVILNFHDQQMQEAISKNYLPFIEFLGHTSSIQTTLNQNQVPKGHAADVANSCDVFSELEGLVNVSEELRKVGKEKSKIQQVYDDTMSTINSPHWDKIPANVQEELKAKASTLQEALKGLDKAIASLVSLGGALLPPASDPSPPDTKSKKKEKKEKTTE